MATTVHLELGEQVSSDDVEDAARAARFRLVNLVPAGDAHPAQAIFTRDAGATILHFLQGAARQWLVITGQEAERAADELRRALQGPAPQASP